jgi:hypothetical protein
MLALDDIRTTRITANSTTNGAERNLWSVGVKPESNLKLKVMIALLLITHVFTFVTCAVFWKEIADLKSQIDALGKRSIR